MKKDAVKRALLIAAGSVSLGLGVTGIFLPVLPTVPFLLLTAYCYARGSKRLYDRLMDHRVLGPYIQNYVEYRAVKLSVKITTLAFLWGTLAISVILVPNFYMRITLAGVGVAVSVHVLCLKTLKAAEPDDSAKDEEGLQG